MDNTSLAIMFLLGVFIFGGLLGLAGSSAIYIVFGNNDTKYYYLKGVFDRIRNKDIPPTMYYKYEYLIMKVCDGAQNMRWRDRKKQPLKVTGDNTLIKAAKRYHHQQISSLFEILLSIEALKEVITKQGDQYLVDKIEMLYLTFGAEVYLMMAAKKYSYNQIMDSTFQELENIRKLMKEREI